MKIEVKSSEVNAKTTSGGKNIRLQDAWIQLNGETRRIELFLGRDVSPYAVGMYELDIEKSLSVNQYGNLEIRRVVLVPVAARKVA